ncbi:gamma-tubulin complex component 5 isoform X2 [Oratosquilla oratoria]|uniref:gamma-tubulin complex component 5 isoform X2 n=1 Tax=Oratosquilla oratoria TaxID=337810 RepID=UPI003F75DBC6
MTYRKYEPLAKELITHLSGFKEDEENFFRCEQYVLSNLLYHHCLDVNSHAVRRSLDGLILKFCVHGQHNRAENLKKLTQRFLKSPFFKDHTVLDIQWSLLSLLLHLSNNPTKFLQGSPQDNPHEVIEVDLASSYAVQEDEVKEDFDWGAYLKEDNEELSSRKDESLSDWSSDEEDEGNVFGPLSISRTQSDVSQCTLLLPAVPEGETSKTGLAHGGASTVGTVTKESSHRAQSWLEANLQPRFWCEKDSGATSMQFNKDPNMVSKLWEENQKWHAVDKPAPKLVSEWVVMREILWVLMKPAESFLITKDTNGVFIMRSNITISSLVQNAFRSYLSTIMPTVQKLEEINKFIKRTNHEIYNFPSTYLSYAQGLNLWSQKFLEHLSKLEKDLKAQEKTCTLLWLNKELKPWINDVAVIYAAHMEGLSVIDTAPNWTKATWLLRALFEHLSSAGDMKSQTVLLRLFLHSLRYYLSIIHNWQYNGNFQDDKDEFLVKRNKDVSVGDENYWKSAYIIKNVKCSDGCFPDQHSRKTVVPFLVPILKSLVVVGKNRELMASLTSHQVSKKGIVKNPSKDDKGSLEQQFVENVQKLLVEASDSKQEQIVDKTEVMENEGSVQDKIVCEVQDRLHSLALQLDDTYLLETHPSTFHFQDKTANRISDDISRTIEGLCINRGLSMERIFSLALHPLIQGEEHVSSSQLLSLLTTEYKLRDHLQLLRGVLLMEEGDVMHEFYSHLFVKIESGDIIDSLGLTLHLQDCISRRFPDFAQSFSVFVKQQDVGVEEDLLEQKEPLEVPDSVDLETAWEDNDSEILIKKLNWSEKVLDDITVHYPVLMHCFLDLRSGLTRTPKCLSHSVFSKNVLSKLYLFSGLCSPIFNLLHFEILKFTCHFIDHVNSLLRLFWESM